MVAGRDLCLALAGTLTRHSMITPGLWGRKETCQGNKVEQALTHVVQFVAHRPAKQKVTGSNPSQGTCLGCGFSPWMGHIQETADPRFFLSLSLSLPFSLKINSLKKKRKKE